MIDPTPQEIERAKMIAERMSPDSSILPGLVCIIADIVRQVGPVIREEERQRCAKICDGWIGRRLATTEPDSNASKAFARGVDMASYYIAADIRGMKS